MDYSKEKLAQLEIVENKKEFIPSQHFTKDEAFITLILHIKNGSDSSTGLFVVSSNKKVIKLEDFVVQNNFKLLRNPDFDNRWSNSSITNFIDGKSKSDLVGTFNKIENLLKNFTIEVTAPEARNFYAFQGMIENTHALTYAM